MTWIRETIHNFSCVFCNRHWSIALDHGAEHVLMNKELHCPWCGGKHIYLADQDFKGQRHRKKKAEME